MLALAAVLTLQAAVDQAMHRVQGAAVVVDVAGGKTLASHGRAAGSPRPPGSTIKPFVLRLALERGVADSRLCELRLGVASRRLECSHPPFRFPMDGAAALAYSCNSYFAGLALRLNRRALADSLNAFGFRARFPLTDDELRLLALGESGVTISPVELAHAYRRLLLVPNPALKPLWDGLAGAVRHGTAQLAAVEQLSVAGKTGTSGTVGRASTRGWFAGYAPADKPQVVVVVFLDRGKGGASAAPIAAKILKAWRDTH